MPAKKKSSPQTEGADCTHCHPGHKRWADLLWGVLYFIRRRDPAAHRAICMTLGLGMEAPPRPVADLFAVHPSRAAQEWAEAFRKSRGAQVKIKEGRPPDTASLGELMVHGVVVWHLRRCSGDREDKVARAYDLKQQWPALMEQIPRSVGGQPLPRRKGEPDFKGLVDGNPSPARLAIRLTAHILGYPERTTENRLTAARRRDPDLAKILKLWGTTGLEMIKST